MSVDRVLSLAAVCVAFVALAFSTWLAFVQSRIQRQGNYLPAIMTLFGSFRSLDFHRHYSFLCRDLGRRHDPQHGISGLPEDAQEAFYDVAYLLQEFALLVYFGILDADQIGGLMYRRVTEVWEAIEPFVLRERQLADTQGRLLRALELFAKDLMANPPQRIDTLGVDHRLLRGKN